MRGRRRPGAPAGLLGRTRPTPRRCPRSPPATSTTCASPRTAARITIYYGDPDADIPQPPTAANLAALGAADGGVHARRTPRRGEHHHRRATTAAGETTTTTAAGDTTTTTAAR